MIRYRGGPRCGEQVRALDMLAPGRGSREARPGVPPFADWNTGAVSYAPLGSYCRYVCFNWCDCGTCVPVFQFVEIVQAGVTK